MISVGVDAHKGEAEGDSGVPLFFFSHSGNVPSPHENLGAKPVEIIKDYKWSSTLKGPDIELLASDGGYSVTRKEGGNWQTVVSNYIMEVSNIFSFDIEIVKTSGVIIHVGVIPSSEDCEKWITKAGVELAWSGGAEKGYSYYYTGYTYHNHARSSTTLGFGFKQGDIVTCVVNLREGTLGYKVNSIFQGIAYENIKGPLRPAVCFKDKGDCIKITNFRGKIYSLLRLLCAE